MATCSRCGSYNNLGLINCRHTTVCLNCAKAMAESKEACSVCGVLFTNLVMEYPVRVCSADDKKYFAAQFRRGLPDFGEEHQWTLNKKSQTSDANAIDLEVLNKDPWILENQEGIKYEGNCVKSSELDDSEYFFLMKEEDGYVIIPCADRFNFVRVAPGTQLTTEQAEEKMEKYNEQADEKIQEFNKRLRTGQRKPTSTSEKPQSPDEKGEHWDHDSSCSDEEDVGDIESVPVPSAIMDFQEKDNEAFLSNSGRDMNNILRKVKESDKNDQDKGSGSGDPST